MYVIEILVPDMENGKMKWSPVHPSGGTPYHFETEAQARNTLNLCYPDMMSERKRVRKLQQGEA